MSIASSNFTILRFGEDLTKANAVPTTIKEIPMTGESFQFSSQFITSQNISSSRQILDQIQTGYDTSGGIQIEMASKVYDSLIAGALWANWQTSPTLAAANITIVKATRTITATTDAFADIVEGQFFQIAKSGTDDILAADLGIYQVETKTDDDEVIVKQIDEATPFPNSVTAKTCHIRASMIRAPKDGKAANMIRHEFAFEREHSDLDPRQFLAFTGNLVNTMNLSAQSASLLTGSFEFIGKNSTIFNSDETGAVTQNGISYTLGASDLTGSRATVAHADPEAFNGFNAVSHVKQVILDGYNINAAGSGSSHTVYFQGLDFSVNNNIRGAQAIGVMGNVDTMAGQLSVTGTINAYFEDEYMYKKFLSGEEFPLSFSVIDENNEGYVFYFPRVTISSSTMNAGGNDQDLVQTIQWTAMFDNTDQGGASTAGYQTSIQIDRFYSSYS